MIMTKYFKLITVICLFFVAQYIYAQVPKPYWAKNAIQAPESGKYIFVYGEGNGTTQEESRRKAFADAVVKGQYELGSVTISAQDIATIENIGLDAAMRFTNRQIKITCQTDPLLIEGDRNTVQYKTYVLIQMSIYADKSARFYDLPRNWDCIDNNYYNEMTQYNERINKLKKAKEREEKSANDSFISRGFNQYISLSIGNGISYGGGNVLGLVFSGRFGGRFGIEPHISVGIISQKYFYYDPQKYSFDDDIHYCDVYTFRLNRLAIEKIKASFNVGVNVFVFKGLYLGINYGAQKLDMIDHYFDDYEQRLNEYEHTPYQNYTYYNCYEGYVGDVYYKDREEDRFSFSIHKGMSFITGYKYYIGDKSDNDVCVYFDFGAGVKCYSETNLDFGFEKFAFAWNAGFGIAF